MSRLRQAQALMTATTAAPIPTNALNGTNRDCGQYYMVQNGDTCNLISVKKSISLSDLYFLNPEINANCTNLLRGLSYCVEPVGCISTYANYTTGATSVNPCLSLPAPTTCFRPLTGYPTTSLMAGNVSFSRATQTATSAWVPTPIPTLPPAPGTISGCAFYQNYFVINETISGGPLTVNECSYIAQSWEVQVSDLE